MSRTADPPPPGDDLLGKSTLQGFFTDPAVLSRIDVWSPRFDFEDELPFHTVTLRFEHGPFFQPSGEREYISGARVCRDPETGLDLLFFRSANSGASALPIGGLYRVNPAAGNGIEPVYEVDFYDDQNPEDTFIAPDGSCRGHALRDAGRTLDAAMRALTSGPPTQPDFDVPVGEPLALSPRRIANAAVRKAFLDIVEVGTEFPVPRFFGVGAAGAYYGDEADRASWRVVEVFHDVFSGAPGALLVQDRRRQTWHACYDYHFGPECDEDGICREDGAGWYYRSLVMRTLRGVSVRDDKLYVEACTTGCVGYADDPDEWAWFEIDLRAHTATRLEKRPAFVPDPDPYTVDVRDPPAVPDLAAIAREMPGPAADAERPAGRPAAEAREVARRAEAERVAQRRARDAALRAGQTFRDPLRSGGAGPEMVVVPAGAFRMGCVSGQDCKDSELPVHRVTIAAPFAVGKYEVTFEEWEACVRGGGCRAGPDPWMDQCVRIGFGCDEDVPAEKTRDGGAAGGGLARMAGRPDLRRLAVAGERDLVPAVERSGMGIRGAGGERDGLPGVRQSIGR